MKTRDYSKEIFKKYYSANSNKILEITLKDETVLEGIFSSFVHGSENSDEPFIIKWHFIDKDDIEKHIHLITLDGSEDYGKTINQEDIKSVKFKE